MKLVAEKHGELPTLAERSQRSKTCDALGNIRYAT